MTDVSVLIDGAPRDSISARDRGFAYGDGVFRTIAVTGGKPELWARQLAKLAADCAALGIPAPDKAALAREAALVLAGHDKAVLKIVVTRGAGGRGYKPPEPAEPTRIVMRAPWPDYSPRFSAKGVAMRLCATRLGLQPRLAGLKHLNRLEQVLARDEWSDPVISEGIMCDAEGRVVEGVMSNLFVMSDGRLLTPDLYRCGVAGVMRELVLEIAASLKLEAEVTDLSLDDLRAADEVFLTNSLIGIWPVRRFEAQEWPVGPVTRRLIVEVGGARARSRSDFPL